MDVPFGSPGLVTLLRENYCILALPFPSCSSFFSWRVLLAVDGFTLKGSIENESRSDEAISDRLDIVGQMKASVTGGRRVLERRALPIAQE